MTDGRPSDPFDNDHDFTPAFGVERPLTDSDAAEALARGDEPTFLSWVTQQQQEADRHPDSILGLALQVRKAVAYEKAAKTAGRAEQKMHHDEALLILERTEKKIDSELEDLRRPWSWARTKPNREAHMRQLEELKKHITDFRAEITRI